MKNNQELSEKICYPIIYSILPVRFFWSSFLRTYFFQHRLDQQLQLN